MEKLKTEASYLIMDDRDFWSTYWGGQYWCVYTHKYNMTARQVHQIKLDLEREYGGYLFCIRRRLGFKFWQPQYRLRIVDKKWSYLLQAEAGF